MIAILLTTLFMGWPEVPKDTFTDRWPRHPMPQYNWEDIWDDPSWQVHRFGKGEILGRCYGVSDIGIKCVWHGAKV